MSFVMAEPLPLSTSAQMPLPQPTSKGLHTKKEKKNTENLEPVGCPSEVGNLFVDTFPGWVEAFPIKQEITTVVAKKILEEIFLRFGVSKVIGLDNGPAFASKVSHGLAKILGTNWKLHCGYCPQSSGQVERMNRRSLK